MKKYLNNKIGYLNTNDFVTIDFERRLGLVLFSIILLLVVPYVSLEIFGILSALFVIYATYIGFCKSGMLASFWSLFLLSFILNENIDWFNIISFIIMLLFISFGLGTAIKKYNNLIKNLSQTKEKLKKSNQNLNIQFKRAKRVHKAFFPNETLQTENFSLNSFYQAAEKISGDYYNYIELEDKVVGYISDVTGHGLDGALINIFIREKINNFLKQNKVVSSKNILKFLLKKFSLENFPADYSLCITLWVLDKNSEKLHYNNAGNHIPLFLITNDDIVEFIEENPPISKVFSLSDYNFANNKIKLGCNDKILFLTDGLIEQRIDNNMYGIERLKKVIKGSIADNNLLNVIYSDFKKMLGDSTQKDDITMFCIQKRCDRILN